LQYSVHLKKRKKKEKEKKGTQKRYGAILEKKILKNRLTVVKWKKSSPNPLPLWNHLSLSLSLARSPGTTLLFVFILFSSVIFLERGI
jgi:hypothetical protein